MTTFLCTSLSISRYSSDIGVFRRENQTTFTCELLSASSPYLPYANSRLGWASLLRAPSPPFRIRVFLLLTDAPRSPDIPSPSFDVLFCLFWPAVVEKLTSLIQAAHPRKCSPLFWCYWIWYIFADDATIVCSSTPVSICFTWLLPTAVLSCTWICRFCAHAYASLYRSSLDLVITDGSLSFYWMVLYCKLCSMTLVLLMNSWFLTSQQSRNSMLPSGGNVPSSQHRLWRLIHFFENIIWITGSGLQDSLMLTPIWASIQRQRAHCTVRICPQTACSLMVNRQFWLSQSWYNLR